MKFQHSSVTVREVVPDADRHTLDGFDYDGSDCLVECRSCNARFVETFETDACPGCSTEEY